MEILIDTLISLMFEGKTQLIKDEKINKIFRYPLMIAIIFLIFFVFIGILAISVNMFKTDKFVGMLCFILTFIYIGYVVIKFSCLFLSKYSKKSK